MPSMIRHVLAPRSVSRILVEVVVPIFAILLLAAASAAEPSPQAPPTPPGPSRPQAQASEPRSPQEPVQNPPLAETRATLPAGTQLALVLTHPIDSKALHRGDTVFAQTTDPVLVSNQVVIPEGAFVQGQVEKLTRQGSRAELSLESASVAFPDGYVVHLSGPVKIESSEGTAWRNPSDGAKTGAILAPLLGSGLGTAIGAAAHTTERTSFAGMTMTSSTPKGVAIGSLTGLAAGAVVSFVLVARSHAFYVAEGAPLEMVLPHAVELSRGAPADRPSRAAGWP